jgi:succinate--hydroxymethylglutarate CoA-transferase
MTRVLAGPYSTMLLADAGAEVLKIENRIGGDDTRSWGPPFFDPTRQLPLTPARIQSIQDSADLFDTSRAPPSAGEGVGVVGEATYYMALNRNKQSLAVDVKSERGREIVLRLAAQSHVFVENFIPGKLASLGLGYEDLRRVNPSIIYASISGFGDKGPFSKFAGYDVMASAFGGLLGITGSEAEPARAGIASTDIITGLNAQAAILSSLFGQARQLAASSEEEQLRKQVCALQQRVAELEQQLQGSKSEKVTNDAPTSFYTSPATSDPRSPVHLTTSLVEAQIAALANVGSAWLAAGVETQRRGTAHGSIVPYQAFPVDMPSEIKPSTNLHDSSSVSSPTTDSGSESSIPRRFLALGALNDKQFKVLVSPKVLNLPELASDPRFTTNPLRVKHKHELLPMIETRLGTESASHWWRVMSEHGIPVAPVHSIGQALSHPQTSQLGMIEFLEYPQSKQGDKYSNTEDGKLLLPVLGPAVKYSQWKVGPRAPPPFLGQHTTSVLKRILRMQDQEVEQLLHDNVIGQHDRWK